MLSTEMVGASGGQRLSDLVCADLASKGWSVIPGYLPAALCTALLGEVRQLHAAGLMQPAGVGRGGGRQVLNEVRSDRIYWLEAAALTPTQAAVWQNLATLQQRFNQELYLGLRRFEAHLTVYPPAGRYAKHVDTFRGTSARSVSFIIYLTADHQPAHGGQLRLYDPADRTVAAVEPYQGTLACFLSAEIPHEVLPTARERYSLAGWFRRDD